MNRRCFIKSCMAVTLGFAVLGTGYALTKYKDNIDIIQKKTEIEKYKKSSIVCVEYHLAEHCNLNCKYCMHFSPIAEKEFYDFDIFKKDINRLSEVTNKKIERINLLGGEPLLNPKINEYCNYTRKYFPNSLIVIYTNSTMLANMDKTFWETLSKNDIALQMNNYNNIVSKEDWKKIISKAHKYGLKYCNFNKVYDKYTEDFIAKNQIQAFDKLNLQINKKDGHIRKCFWRYNIANLVQGGNLFPCFVPAYVRHLNKKYNTKFNITNNDYINIYKIKDINDILQFFSKNPPFCEYCTEETIGLKWETSSEHNIEEWIIT